MQQVITEKQARQILGGGKGGGGAGRKGVAAAGGDGGDGRKPFEIVEYETAVRALSECLTLDEAKYWDNKADALAAWAKIYHSPEAERKAKQLKLHARDRMGALARELRPAGKPNQGRRGMAPGPMSLLVEHGLSHNEAREATHISKLPREVLRAAVDRTKVPSPSRLYTITRGASSQRSDGWVAFSAGGIPSARSFCRANDAGSVARSLTRDESLRAREMAQEISEWLDAFEQALPKTIEGTPHD